ncbi:hypothetical protein Trco_005730 [Trichoderma cornu-damae]|uniref:Cell wall proline rich protein n=1 Tax=Trichoderma cornu-damae TaxID=654480 RepID=A0A9P8TW15_9HYPO|nr:hypothetical protein Trco_005730 [Trichoderma cornu-damae]
MMATALYSPERAAVASPIHHIEGPVDYLASLDDATGASFARGSASRHGALPPPNPQFAFPAAPPSPSSHDPTTKRRRPLSAVEMPSRPLSIAVDGFDRGSRHAALPAFSFNPGASLPPDPRAFLSPPHSPSSAKPIPASNRPMGHGHRRGGSEFVGGRLREGSTIAVASTSPPKNEFDLKAPTLQPPPRRGHRRGMSATIPATDLPILFAPPAIGSLPQGNSAPNSPTIFGRKDDLPIIGPDFPLPEPMRLGNGGRNTGNPIALQVAPEGQLKVAKPMMRARVGFSDTLEFIPRPLSLVSNDTSSTVTARPGHSVSGSVSSVISIASLNGRDGSAPLSRTPTGEPFESRPSTAGAVLERTADLRVTDEPPTSPRRRNSIPALINVADADAVESSMSTPTKPAKRWSFFGLDAFASGSPMKRRPSTSSSSDTTPRPIDRISCSDRGSESSLDTTEATPGKQKKGSKKGDKKKKKKKKKAKGWAGSILPLKGHKKRGKSSAVRPPTPPASVSHLDDDEDDEAERDSREPAFDPPTISITESPSLPEQPEPPRGSSEDVSYPMIDLDAALGPFNTPLSYNAEWEAAQRAAGTPGSRRRLHSAQGLKGFSGPGMHYHRRAESAPDLPPFDFRSSIHRFGSSSAMSTMADVFEEDEEDDDGKGKARSELATSEETSEESDGETTPPAFMPILKDPFLGPSDKMLWKMRRGSSGLIERESFSPHAIRAEMSKASLQDETITEEFTMPIFRAPAFQGRRDSVDSGAPSAPSPRQVPTTAELSVDEHPLVLPGASVTPLSPYSASYVSSSHPSPRSPVSVDAQRISTAPSSVTDDSFHSLLMGEPGPEVRISMDYDVPSRASSNSAMTRDSSFIPAPRPRQPLSRDQRPVSMSAPFGRRRSSLASLSRLISSSHGERSKLSMEVTLDNEPESKKSKSSKTKRLGRMMQFWKPNKDDAAA